LRSVSLPVFHCATAAEAVSGQVLTVGEDVAGHAVRVRRIGPGEQIEIVDGQGTRARGTVTAASATQMGLDIAEVTTEEAMRPRQIGRASCRERVEEREMGVAGER